MGKLSKFRCVIPKVSLLKVSTLKTSRLTAKKSTTPRKWKRRKITTNNNTGKNNKRGKKERKRNQEEEEEFLMADGSTTFAPAGGYGQPTLDTQSNQVTKLGNLMRKKNITGFKVYNDQSGEVDYVSDSEPSGDESEYDDYETVQARSQPKEPPPIPPRKPRRRRKVLSFARIRDMSFAGGRGSKNRIAPNGGDDVEFEGVAEVERVPYRLRQKERKRQQSKQRAVAQRKQPSTSHATKNKAQKHWRQAKETKNQGTGTTGFSVPKGTVERKRSQFNSKSTHEQDTNGQSELERAFARRKTGTSATSSSFGTQRTFGKKNSREQGAWHTPRFGTATSSVTSGSSKSSVTEDFLRQKAAEKNREKDASQSASQTKGSKFDTLRSRFTDSRLTKPGKSYQVARRVMNKNSKTGTLSSTLSSKASSGSVRERQEEQRSTGFSTETYSSKPYQKRETATSSTTPWRKTGGKPPAPSVLPPTKSYPKPNQKAENSSWRAGEKPSSHIVPKYRLANKIVKQEREKKLRDSIRGIKNLASFWGEQQERNKAKQEANPFSSAFNGNRQVLAENVMESKSGQRAKQAQEWTTKEIKKLVEIIKEYGIFSKADNATKITFGELFIIYEQVSDSLVFMLKKAKKRQLIYFDAGELLLQGRDDHVLIYAYH